MGLYKLYGTGVTDAVASLDIVANGNIVAIAVAHEADLPADNNTSRMEVSFSSTSGFTSNDTKSSIITSRLFASLVTSGLATTGANFGVSGLKIPVTLGERIYLHGSGTTMTATVYIYTDDRSAAGRRQRL